MIRSATFLGALLVLLVALPQSATAQGRPQTRQGFFIGFGLGGGSFGCEGCGSRETGAAGYLKLGGAVSPRLLIAGESIAWTKEEGGARVTHANVSAIAQFYPSAASGFFLKGGLGFSRKEASASAFLFSAGESGLGLTAGLGYDVRLGTNFSLSPYESFGWGSFDDGSANNAQLGLGVTWH